ncbi:hypothetical protein CFR80_14075 [Komagataeibacter oboediens]|uniref:Uncharacterized protein n=1 Tax=Komagataeibacter oboediens TaxID=65958 RepID=A0A318QKI4_9PROT|nr:hypothetical protein CFR80_14075 [Komagataeibacter oboediens]
MTVDHVQEDMDMSGAPVARRRQVRQQFPHPAPQDIRRTGTACYGHGHICHGSAGGNPILH